MTSHINLLSRLARVNGVYGPAINQLSGSPVLDEFGRVLIERPSANQIPNPTFTGLAYGTVGSGGTLPTSIARTNTIPVEVLPSPAGTFRHRVYRDNSGSPTTAAPQISATGAAPGIIPTDISRGGIAASGRLAIRSCTANITRVQITLAAYAGGVLQRRADYKLLPTGRSKRFALWVQVLAGETVHFWWAPTVDSASPTASTDPFSATIEVEKLQLESATDGQDVTSFITGTRASAQTCTVPVTGAASVLVEGPKPRWIDTTGNVSLPVDVSYLVEQVHIRQSLSLSAKNALVDTIHPALWDYSAHDLDQIAFEGTTVQVQRPDVQPAEQHSFAVALNRQSMSRFEIRPGWVWATDPPEGNANQRCEVKHSEVLPTSGDVWLSMALYIEPGAAAANFKILCQFFTNGDIDPGTGNSEWHGPTVTMQLLAGDTLTMFTRGDSQPITTSSVSQHAAWSITHFPRGVWHQFVHRLTFSTSGGGYLKSWHNGAVVFDAATALGFNNVQGCSFKHGLYCGVSSDTIAVRDANVEVGTVDLSDRVPNPLPIV